MLSAELCGLGLSVSVVASTAGESREAFALLATDTPHNSANARSIGQARALGKNYSALSTSGRAACLIWRTPQGTVSKAIPSGLNRERKLFQLAQSFFDESQHVEAMERRAVAERGPCENHLQRAAGAFQLCFCEDFGWLAHSGK